MPRHFPSRSLGVAAITAILLAGAGISGCSRTDTTASLLADAKQYQQKGDTKAALIQLKNAVAKSPEDGEARFLLSSLYLETGDAVSAEKEIRKAIALGISADRTAPILAKSLFAQGQYQKALDEAKAELAKNSAPLLTLRGDAHLALGDSAKAKEAYDQALLIAPNSGDVLIGLARHAIVQKDVEAANRYAVDATTKDPKNAEAWMFKGSLLRGQGKSEDALAAFSQTLALTPAHRSAHVEKAQINIGMRKFDAAKTELDAARKTTGANPLVTYTQALLDFEQGNHTAARESLQKVLRVAPNHMPSILLAGAVELKLGALEQSEQYLRKYLEAVPQNLYARKLLAQALLQHAQPSQATAVLAPALKNAANDPQLLALAGESSLKSRDFSQATAYFEKASALAPDMAGLHTSLGLSRLAQGDHAKAVSELEKGVALDTKSSNAGAALVRTQLGLKNYDAALSAALALEKQHPDSAPVRELLGVVHLAKGDRAKARASFEKAIAIAPDHFSGVLFLAQMDMQENKQKEAKARLEAVLVKDKKHIAAMTALAEIAAKQGNVAEATTWLEKATAENPEAVGPAMRLAGLYLRSKQQQKALTLVRKFQAANPANPELLDLLGQAQIANNDAQGALETYSKLVNVTPKATMPHVRLGAVHMMLKNEAVAADDFKRALSLDPGMVQARLGQIQLAMQSNKPDEALAIVRALQKQSATAVAAYLLEADIQLSQKQPALALAATEKAFAQAPSEQLLLKVATAMRRAGKSKDVEPRLLQWQKAHPGDRLVPMYLAELSLAEKKNKVAIERLDAIVKTSPKNVVALNNLAWAYQQEKDPRAVDSAEKALQLAPESPAVLDTLGWILVQQGKTARALPLLQKAVGLAPDAAEIRYHLAFALNQGGDKANARKELDKLLSSNKPFAQMDDAKVLLKAL